MKAQKELEKKIRQKQEEADVLRKEMERKKIELEKTEAYIEALEESLRVFQRLSTDNGRATTIRPNSQVYKAREVLRSYGEPMHVGRILEVMGKEPTKRNRISLSGSLGVYVRNGQVFTRPAPNTFGLVEFAEKNEQTTAPKLSKDEA